MRKLAVTTLLLAAVLAGCVHSAPKSTLLSAWTQATVDGYQVRAIATGGCPALTIDGRSVLMAAREAADAAFPQIACQAGLPKDAKAISVDGRSVPPVVPAVKRILVLGDTGCRIKKSIIQDCDDAGAWPFAQLARSAAAEHPDLVIHVGDYYYRETPCPADHTGCAGSPYGDAWPAWAADFFTPAAPLLAAAPWVLVRGNHEQCGRGADGWFRFLDAGTAPLICPASSASYAVPLGPVTLYVVDSADTDDDKAPDRKVALFKSEMESLQPGLGAGPGWLLTHRPVWGFAPPAVGPEAGEIEEGIELPVNLTEQAAIESEKLDGIRMVLSGHVHLFAAADFAGKRPPQLIVGNGGDLRDGALPGIQQGRVSIAQLPAQAFVIEQFGYLVLELGPDGWHGTMKGADGAPLARCSLTGKALGCQPA